MRLPKLISVRSRVKRFTITLSACACVAAMEMPAFAQQAPAPAAGPADTQLTEIIVTGSRIAAPNEVSTSPIVVMSSKYIETSGKTDISDLIMQLPQNLNNSLGQDLGNTSSGLTTAGGIATADLRGLGPNRTLVLVDGRRLGQGSPYTFIQSPAPDLDQIPAGLVERIEVVTGGASAAYGSDAIAGVINFIMKKNFQGFQVDGQYDEYYHDNGDTYMQNLVRNFDNTIPATGTSQDGRQRTFDALMGTNFADGEGNITAYLSWRHADPVASSQRDYGGCELYPTYAQTALGKTVVGSHCDGSANSNLWSPNTGPQAGNAYSVLGNTFVPFPTAGTNPPAAFNSQPYIFMTREDDRANAAVLGHLTVTDYFQPYTEFYFMDDRTHQEVAPAAAFFQANPFDPTLSGGYPVNCNNPFLSGQQQSILCTPAQITAAKANPTSPCTLATPSSFTNCSDVLIGRRNVEGVGRESDYEHENYRAVLGTKGDILENGALSYDLYGQYFYTTFSNNNLNYFNFLGIDNALQVYSNNGTPTCVSGPPCVPWNIFKDGGVSQAALNYLYVDGTGIGTSTLRTEHGELTSQLGTWGITSPLAHDGIAVDAGFEHRNDNEFFQPDNAELTGILSGFGSAATPIDESLSVTEGFTEIRAPLIQNMPFAKELLFDTGYRYSDYTSSSGTTNIGFQAHTYKFEVQYAPIEDVRLRVSYDKAIRAPSIIELYNPQLVGLIQSGNDPCAPPVTFSQEQCANLGVSAAQYAASKAGHAVNGVNPIPQCIAGQCSQLTGGNTALKPEEGETYTIGINFSPSFLPKFTGSIDYYHIAISGEVNVLPASNILTGCADTGNPVLCSAVVRSPATGSLNGSSLATGGYIVQTDVNLSSVLASGIDLQLAYQQDLPPGFGKLQFELNGTWLQHLTTIVVPGGPSYDCAGLFGFTCQTVNPRWHHIFRTTWNTPWDVSGSLTWRYISAVSQDADTGNPLLANPNYSYDAYNATIGSQSYLDMEVTWHPTKVLTVRAGANNILDKDPPLLVSQTGIVAGGSANTLDAYDIFGRQLFVAFSAKF
jgi:iron complex outermembrane recepter protein